MGKIVFLRNHPNKAAYRGTKKSRGFMRALKKYLYRNQV